MAYSPGADRPPSSFTMLWPRSYLRKVVRRHREYPEALPFLWGGHNLQTRFSHFGIRSGDTIYPVSVVDRQLLLIARMTVARTMELEEYLEDREEHRWYVDQSSATEALAGTHGSLVHSDLRVPRDVLERWRFTATRGERSIKELVDGEIRRPIAFQGTYRLSAGTAADLFGLLLEHEARTYLRGSRLES